MERHESKELKSKFIKARALEGKSFDNIVKDLGVSKPTLIKWERKYFEQICALQDADVSMVLDEYKIGLKHRIMSLNSIAKKLMREIENRDFTKLDDEKLINQFVKVSDTLYMIVEKHRPCKPSVFEESHELY